MRTKSILLLFSLLAIVNSPALSVCDAAAQELSVAPSNESKWDYKELENAPEKARSWTNPIQGDPNAASAGEKLFDLHCAECHGKKAEGRKKAPSLLRHEVQDAAPGALFWILTNGVVRHGMPVWSKLPEPQRWQIVVFLKSLRTSRDVMPDQK